jgi:thiol-disulfide isomerase/thioredoxin
MSESANIDYSGLSENEAEAQFAQVDKQIVEMEDRRQTQSKDFLDLLRHKLGLSERLKRYQEVNNCEMRIRFIEARMRGEDMPHTEYVNLERKQRRKRRNKVNTMMIVVIAMVVMVIGSVPILKSIVDRMHEHSAQIEAVEGGGTALQDTADTAAATAPPAVSPQASQLSSANTAPAASEASLPAATNVDELNSTTGGQQLDLNKILQPGRITALYFHSIHCPACVANKPKYAQLAAMYPEYKFYTVDVDRPFSEEIDRDSPVCKQFGIKHFPYYMIFNGTQQQSAGIAASTQMRDWYVAKAPK